MQITHPIYSQFPAVFCKDPIIITVNTTAADTPVGALMPTVVLVVTTDKEEYTFMAAFIGEDEVRIDISSAFRAEYMKQDAATPVSHKNGGYTPINARITAYIQYLYQGNTVKGPVSNVFPATASGEPLHVLRGGVGDKQRLIIGNPCEAVQRFKDNLSQKPDSAETVREGDNLYRSTYDITLNRVETTTLDPSGQDVLIAPAKNRTSFLFINSFGVLESVSAQSLTEWTDGIRSDNLTALLKPAYTGGKQAFNFSTPLPPRCKLSSGYVNRAWAQWWTTEFLTARHCWIKTQIEGTDITIPVRIEPEDEDIITHKTDAPHIPEVIFTATLLYSTP